MPRSVGNLHLSQGRRVDAVEHEQGQGGGGGDDGDGDGAFVLHLNTNSTSTLAELGAELQTMDAAYDETIAVGTNNGLFDATGSGEGVAAYK